MIVVRLFALLALIGIGGALVAWFVTGDPRYRRLAWRFFQGGVFLLLLLFGIFAVERVF